MAVPGKPFRKLTKDEAKVIVKDITRTSRSEEEIRRRLTEAGFSGGGAGAAVCTHSFGGMFMAMVMVWGPRGEVISA